MGKHMLSKDSFYSPLSVKELIDLIESGNISQIKMRTKYVASHDGGRSSIEDTIGLSNFNVVLRTYGYSISWSTEEGDPNITLQNGNDLINFIPDNSDSDYLYMLYV